MIRGFLRKRLPRLGKIRLGAKAVSAKSGKEYPKDLGYFACPPEVEAVYGEQPAALHVMVPTPNISEWFPVSLKMYGTGEKLKCRGDGEIATCFDEATGQWVERACLYKECPFFMDRQCTEVGNLMVILPRVSIGGVYQIDTGSWHGINNVYNEFQAFKDVLSGIIGNERAVLGVEFVLTREKETLQVVEGGKRESREKFILHLRPPAISLEQAKALGSQARALPAPADLPQLSAGDVAEGEFEPEAEVEIELDESEPTDLYPNAAPVGPDLGQKAAWAALLEQVKALGKDADKAEKAAVRSVDPEAASFSDLAGETQAAAAIDALTGAVEKWQAKAAEEEPAVPEAEPKPKKSSKATMTF